ncbi:fatty acid synthase alpha subunit Lsd1 [Coemansia sp. RSA 2618]|nr:fatty acid synthase alpha subunit Lsd1 [Coemansia sp. RSA 2618]
MANHAEMPACEDIVDDRTVLRGVDFAIAEEHIRFEMILAEGVRPLCAGDVITAVSTVPKLYNKAGGKLLSVSSVIERDGQPVGTFDIGLLYRGYYVEPSKAYRHASVRLQPNVPIEFCLDSEYRFKSDGLYSSIATSGTVTVKARGGRRVHIADVDFQWNTAKENPVLEFLNKYKVDPELSMFESGGYSLVSSANVHLAQATVPDSNWDYARLSQDGNPIHINPYVGDLAGNQGTVTHGLWTSASTRSIVERIVACGSPERIRTHRAEFIDMVFPSDRLTTELYHVGMKRGRMLVKSQASNAEGAPVITCITEIDQPLTAYVFTGQGSHQVGMGMDLYEQSPAARNVWERASRHMLATYAVDLLNIVRTNPVQHTVNFRGRAGEQILRNYLEFGNMPLLPELTAESTSFTFRAANGLLNATQFTQVVLVTAALAAVADMRAQALVQKHALFAGHSLGELCALGALTDVFVLEDLLDIVFFRGLIMQSAVQRDERGNSGFGMVAVDPSRIGATLDESRLHRVIDAISASSLGLLQIVNYNVRGHQYAVAGSLGSLATLRLVLDNIAVDGIATDSTLADKDFEHSVGQIVNKVLALPASDEPVRGRATIPLTGIDVPFHSRLLLNGVSLFRDVLRAKIGSDEIVADEFCQHYVPNLTAVPFDISKPYFELVYDTTKSAVIEEALAGWDDARLDDTSERSRLGTMLLIELLAYQLASPVQWIKTQDRLFSAAGVQRMVEIGPSPVLCDMAARTLKAVHGSKRADLLHVERDHDAVYYVQPVVEDAINADSKPAPDVSSPELAQKQAIQAKPVEPEPLLPSDPQPQPGSGVSKPIADQPVSTLDVVLAIVAFKMKKSLSDVSAEQSIKTLVAGKSIMQNEIVGDLQKEFDNKVPDKAEELPLQELATAIGSTRGTLGKCTQSLVTRMVSGKMPGGFSLSQIRNTLQESYGLGPLRQDALLLVALTMEPAARLADKANAGAWLDAVAQTYASRANISYSTELSMSDAAGHASQGPTISSAEMQKIRQREIEHIQAQIQVLARYAGMDLRDGARAAERAQAESTELQSKLDSTQAELGDEFTLGIQPQFDSRKARRFDSYWNWARQEAFVQIQQVVVRCSAGDINPNAICTGADEVATLHRLRNCADAKLLDLLAGTAKILRSSRMTLKPAAELVERLHSACQQAIGEDPTYRELSTPVRPQTRISVKDNVSYTEVCREDEPTFAEYVEHMNAKSASGSPPLLHMRERTSGGQWGYDEALSSTYFDGLLDIACQGLSFAGKTALVTGCGRGSIGAELVRGLLMGGAKVLATTSSYSRKTTLFFEDMYRQHGARGSELVVVPFNQGSVQDIDSLVGFVFGTDASQLGWNLDYVFPFAAVPDIGSMATNLGSRSELALRVMLTNVLRLLGAIKVAKEAYKCPRSPSLVVLPLSPNHGNLGGDGLYGECKLALETAFHRWESEEWEGYLSIAGAFIGWTRGTSLMSATNLVAQKIESLGVRTFSAREMAFNILGLLHPQISRIAHRQPVWADLNGGLDRQDKLGKLMAAERNRIDQKSKVMRRSTQAVTNDLLAIHQEFAFPLGVEIDLTPLAKPWVHSPRAKSYDELQHLHHLQGMVNLDKVVVVTGYGEVSPHGNAETRWEIEAFGELSTEGCIELAWIMGLIKHHNGPLATTGEHYIGWVDAQSNEPVDDVDVKPRFHEYIMAHTGIRLIEPELAGGYDPAKKAVLNEVLIEHDMAPFEASANEAAAFKQSNGDRVDIWKNADEATWSVRFLAGAAIRVPMAVSADRLVAAMLPTGWNAAHFGIPDDIIHQVDPVTLYALVATVEALVRSGITDPYELYQHFHVSEVGSTMGSGVGGGHGLYDVYHKRFLNGEVQSDALQEVFISTIQAWINMLLMSGSGPVKPAVGACATAMLSIDTAVDTIQSGKAKVMLVGGVDDFAEESSTEFASMGATSNSIEEFASGRTPAEMCRPCTSTRNGFMEGQGCGVAVLMSATAALECGAPIYGIIAMSGSATDKQGRSVPAPGQGILTSVREANGNSFRLLDIKYRRHKLYRQLDLLKVWKQDELDGIYAGDSGTELDGSSSDSLCADIEQAYQRQKRVLRDTWGNEFWKQHAGISPLRGSLAVWGLTAEDIGLASFHGTSTKANDKNESEVLNTQLRHLGRTPGHVVPAVCQKWLTGHSKGAAASFMLNGVLQSLRTGLVPGNRNADNIAAELKEYDYALYLSQTVQTTGIKAALLKSFGFGQVGGELLVLHPDYVLATLNQSQLEAYNTMLEQRNAKAFRYQQDVLVGNRPFVQVKSQPPYTPDQEQSVYLNPLARAHFDPMLEEYHF